MTAASLFVTIAVPVIIVLIISIVVLLNWPEDQDRRHDDRDRQPDLRRPGFFEWILTPEYKRAGILGEEAAERIIRSVLRDDDILLTNINIEYNGKPAELDNVIVNKYGVFIIEVKNYSGQLVGGENDYEWMHYKTTEAGNTFEKTDKNPIRQVRRQTDVLARYLRYYGVQIWVRGYAILLQNNSPIPSEYILSSPADIARAIHTRDRRMLDPGTIRKVTDLLINTGAGEARVR